MNALIKTTPVFFPLQVDSVDNVTAYENELHEFPWTAGNFRDSINAGYSSWLCTIKQELAGYAVVMIAAQEAHLLNISVLKSWQNQGIGKLFLSFLMNLARERYCERMLLEVRCSNYVAQRLYEKLGFAVIGMRKNYYPAANGREDAMIYECVL